MIVAACCVTGRSSLGYTRHAETVSAPVDDGTSDGAPSLFELVANFERPRILWLMVPAASVDGTHDQLVPLLGPDFADKVLSAMRFGFGGHLEKTT